MYSQITALTGILVLATLVESLVEYFLHPWVKPWGDQEPPPDLQPSLTFRNMLLRYVAAIVAIGLCVLYQVDLLALAGLYSPWPLTGQIITGFIAGRGANFVHDFAGRWLG